MIIIRVGPAVKHDYLFEKKMSRYHVIIKSFMKESMDFQAHYMRIRGGVMG